MGLREGNAAKPSGDVYDVFAKTRKERALHHIGDVLAPAPGLAKAYAYQMYQESTWHDMVVVPRRAIATLVDDGAPTENGLAPGPAVQWEVCGRRDKAEALVMLGALEAAPAAMAGAAKQAFGEGWLELAAWPASATVVVLADEEGKAR